MDQVTKWMRELRIARVDCEAVLVEQHLDAFVDAFVGAPYRDRVRQLLLRDGWHRTSQLIEKRLDAQRCRVDDDQSRPRVWAAPFLAQGIYIAGDGGLWMQIQQASELSARTCSDALFSIVPGRLAVFLDHDWGVWYCVAPPA